MMNKKAFEMATSTIITIVLGLVILIIAIVLVQQQVSKSGQKIGKIEEESELEPNKCASLVLGRYCIESGQCKDDKGNIKTVPEPPGGWTDCGKGQLTGKRDCCSRF